MHVPYVRSTGADTLTPDGSITRQVVLQGNPISLTPGLHSGTGTSGNKPTTTIVTSDYSALRTASLYLALPHSHMGSHLTRKALYKNLSITTRKRRLIPNTITHRHEFYTR